MPDVLHKREPYRILEVALIFIFLLGTMALITGHFRILSSHQVCLQTCACICAACTLYCATVTTGGTMPQKITVFA